MKRALCGTAAVLALAGAAVPVAFAASGGAKGPEPKVTFCHATSSEDNPYVKITTANAALVRAHMKNHDDVRPDSTGACPSSVGGGGGGGGGVEL
jgi:ABC-type sugar transport system substrate-binding protein